MPRTIIVSDLHVDTWDDEKYGAGERSKTKLDHWRDFLGWCTEKRVDELVINGDLMDAPPYEGNVSFTSPIARQAVEELLAHARAHKVTYVYGNHDIGISGIRCTADANVSPLQNVSLYYPDYVLLTQSSTLLIQHGHLFDPALLLYIRDLTLRTYLRSKFQAFQWVQQRRDTKTGLRISPPGVASPATINLGPASGDNVYYAIRLTDVVAPPAPEDANAARRFIRNLKRGVVTKISESVKHYLWWEAAKGIFEDYCAQPNVQTSVIYCVMGHTHVPDTGETTVDGNHCIYFNSGTWTGAGQNTEDRQHATYLDVRETGKVWIQDWIRDPYLEDPPA